MRLGIIVLALASVTLAFVPLSTACVNGRTLCGWTDGAQTRTEVVGSGASSVGIYTRDHQSWGDQAYTSWCRPVSESATAPAIVVPDVDTPELRVLANTIPSNHVASGMPVTGPTPVSTPGVNTNPVPECLAGARDVGVYAHVGVNDISGGTDAALFPDLPLLP